ncbi:MAG: tetratricopeptide repeat protein, partial [bacterium]
HIVNSQDLGNALATSKIPLFVLNACQSAEEGKSDPYSSVASQLVAVGAKGVVAMSYSVYATTAALFIRRFYESLVRHSSLAEAVAAGRQELYSNPHRDSVIGALELRDWLVPTLYQQEAKYIPIPEGMGAVPDEESAEEKDTGKGVEEKCPEGRFGFIGRDYDILRIERAMRDDKNPWALLTGMGGIGKTELAFGFARWYWETGGCPGGVFAVSFREKADFAQVIGSIAGFGTDFSILPEEKQFQTLVGYLKQNACLLIWDNFEPVAGYPEGTEPLASEEERDKLSRFLKALRGGKSRVLITTRKPAEDWIGIAYEQVELRGLDIQDAGQLAKAILKTVGRRPEDFKDDPDYARLIKLLNGHPRSLEVVLPQLKTKLPAEIIDTLQHRVDKWGEAMEDASLAFAFSQMSEKTQKHLPFIGLFVSYVHADMLGNFVAYGDKQQEVYEEVMGEMLDADAWESILNEAGGAGLLRPLRNRIYELHPTLPAFLRRRLSLAISETNVKRLDTEFMVFYRGCAKDVFQSLRRGEIESISVMIFEEGNFLRALRIAQKERKWAIAQVIIQTINDFYEAQGRRKELAPLISTLAFTAERDMPPHVESEQASLWRYLVGWQANDAVTRRDLDGAENAYRRILRFLKSSNDPHVEPHMAVCYHLLGVVALERGQFEIAKSLLTRSKEINERLGLKGQAAANYRALGNVAFRQQNLEEAQLWYEKAVKTNEAIPRAREMAMDYLGLGNVALEKRECDVAESWYRKTRAILEPFGPSQDLAMLWHQLARLSEVREQYEQAESQYRSSLQIKENLSLKQDAVSTYHQLGILAEKRQRLEEAEKWYEKALEIAESLGYPPMLVESLSQLGMLRLNQRRFSESLILLGEVFAITEQYNLQTPNTVLKGLAVIMEIMGEEEFASAWRDAFEDQEPPLEALREILRKMEEES